MKPCFGRQAVGHGRFHRVSKVSMMPNADQLRIH